MSIKLLNLKGRIDDDEDENDRPDGGRYQPLTEETTGNRPPSFSFLPNDNIKLRARSDEISVSSDDWSDINLLQAASEGAIDRIKLYFGEIKNKFGLGSKDFGQERDQTDKQGYNAIHLAARYNRKNVVAYLLDNGANIDNPDGEYRNTPLLLATK